MEETLANKTFGEPITGLLIDRLHRLGAERYPDLYGALGVEKPALVVLLALAATGPCRQARLGEQTRIDPATMVGLLNELEAKGLARREPDPADRRAHAVTITAAGRRLLAQASRLAAHDDFFAALTAEERQVLDGLLLRLIAANGG